MIGVEAHGAMILERERTLDRAPIRSGSRFTAMNELRAAVIGVGRLGAIHAHKYAAIASLKLTYVVDTDAMRAADIARELGAKALTDYRELARPNRPGERRVAGRHSSCDRRRSDCARASTYWWKSRWLRPWPRRAISKAIAERSGRILQIGHLERFNPAIVRLRSILNAPRFVECHRLAPFTERGTDVDVVLDLMVHDLDVILSRLAPRRRFRWKRWASPY